MSYYLDKDSIDVMKQAPSYLRLTNKAFSDECHIGLTTYGRIINGKPVNLNTVEEVEKYFEQNEKLSKMKRLNWIIKPKKRDEQEYKHNNHNLNNINNGSIPTIKEPNNLESSFSSIRLNNQHISNDDYLDERIAEIQKTLESKINEKCGKIRVLKMGEPIATLKVYVNIDIISKQNERRLYLDNPLASELVRLKKYSEPDSQRIIVVGSTGSGKTMLLRRLALSCFQEKSLLKKKQHFPLYISLRDYIENGEKIPKLEQYIVYEYSIEISDIELLSKTGRLLILFDGFDSINSDSKKFVYHQINAFIDRFPNNDYIISCKSDKHIFERFEQVKLRPLDYKQICSLIKNRIDVKSPYLSEKQENELLKQIDDDKDLLLIAQNPLLLVLICLVYAERGIDGLQKEKWKVIYEAVFVLLEGWDREQGIIYETETNFSKRDKSKFLSFIAFSLTQSGKDRLDQQTLEEYTSEYIQKILSTYPYLTPEKLYTVEDILTSLESEHTLLIRRSDLKYEFSNLIFKDFFTLIFIRSEFKSLEKFESQDMVRQHPTRWERFLTVAKNAYPIIFDD